MIPHAFADVDNALTPLLSHLETTFKAKCSSSLYIAATSYGRLSHPAALSCSVNKRRKMRLVNLVSLAVALYAILLSRWLAKTFDTIHTKLYQPTFPADGSPIENEPGMELVYTLRNIGECSVCRVWMVLIVIQI